MTSISHNYYRGYLWALAISFDQLGNALAGGHPDVTISARIGRGAALGLRPAWWWKAARWCVDWAFKPYEDNHCHGAYYGHQQWDVPDKIRRGNDVGLVVVTLILLGFVPWLGILFRIHAFFRGLV